MVTISTVIKSYEQLTSVQNINSLNRIYESCKSFTKKNTYISRIEEKKFYKSHLKKAHKH